MQEYYKNHIFGRIIQDSRTKCIFAHLGRFRHILLFKSCQAVFEYHVKSVDTSSHNAQPTCSIIFVKLKLRILIKSELQEKRFQKKIELSLNRNGSVEDMICKACNDMQTEYSYLQHKIVESFTYTVICTVIGSRDGKNLKLVIH